MFKNQTTFNKADPNIQNQNLSQDKDLKIGDIPIYTMAKDLEEIEHPTVKNEAAEHKSLSRQIDEASLNEKQQSSPFFAANNAHKISEAPINIPIPTKKTETKHSFWSSIFGSDAPQKEKEQRDARKKLAEQQAAEQKAREIEITEQKKIEEERIIAEQKRIAEQQAAEQKAREIEIAKQNKIKKERLAEEQKIAIKKTLPNPTNNSPRNKSNVAAIVVILFVLAIIGAGAYYYISTRQITPAPEVIVEKTTEEVPMPPKAEEKPVFSIEKPNYIVIDTATTDNVKIREIIDAYTEDIKKSSTTIPVEFIITDTQNNPVKFAMFAQKIGLTLSKNTLASLADNFSLFIFNDSGNIRLGLAIDLTSSTKIEAALLKEEPLLAKNLSAILLSTAYELPKTTFGKSDYKDMVIRYQNIVSPENLSIDYALTKKQLLIGTTKMTLRSIIDRLAPAKQAIETQNATTTTNVITPTNAITE